MERHGEEIHLETREARAAAGPRSMRYVLAISLALIVAVFAAIWIVKATHTADVTDPAQRAAPASPVPMQQGAP
jgi:formate hydrogenlyase subunit 4